MMAAEAVAEITGNLIAEYRTMRGDLYRDLSLGGIDVNTVPLQHLPRDLRVRWERVNGMAARVNDHLEILSEASLTMAGMQQLRDQADNYREILGRYVNG
jgi:hypothetical protein